MIRQSTLSMLNLLEKEFSLIEYFSIVEALVGW